MLSMWLNESLIFFVLVPYHFKEPIILTRGLMNLVNDHGRMKALTASVKEIIRSSASPFPLVEEIVTMN